mmetsp:Transcript_129233/g.374145  ORF Transcript_129233/g.374145 Transcript_129233/m.374145 type:complete len:308 (-) Transcript_129233:166-1089(-)
MCMSTSASNSDVRAAAWLSDLAGNRTIAIRSCALRSGNSASRSRSMSWISVEILPDRNASWTAEPACVAMDSLLAVQAMRLSHLAASSRTSGSASWKSAICKLAMQSASKPGSSTWVSAESIMRASGARTTSPRKRAATARMYASTPSSTSFFRRRATQAPSKSADRCRHGPPAARPGRSRSIPGRKRQPTQAMPTFEHPPWNSSPLRRRALAEPSISAHARATPSLPATGRSPPLRKFLLRMLPRCYGGPRSHPPARREARPKAPQPTRRSTASVWAHYRPWPPPRNAHRESSRQRNAPWNPGAVS